jgi:hypothetical protein
LPRQTPRTRSRGPLRSPRRSCGSLTPFVRANGSDTCCSKPALQPSRQPSSFKLPIPSKARAPRAPRRSGGGAFGAPAERRRGGSPRGAAARNRLERETGIEPATNSLEGCDSTTELLPPSRLAQLRLLAASTWQAAFLCLRASRCAFGVLEKPSPERALLLASQRRMVARGGFEPPKPLGRQIYSLLRLTASLPRRCRYAVIRRSERGAAATREN